MRVKRRRRFEKGVEGEKVQGREGAGEAARTFFRTRPEGSAGLLWRIRARARRLHGAVGVASSNNGSLRTHERRGVRSPGDSIELTESSHGKERTKGFQVGLFAYISGRIHFFFRKKRTGSSKRTRGKFVQPASD
eukprot:1783014-Pleurochrysis_carterae.AAC.1